MKNIFKSKNKKIDAAIDILFFILAGIAYAISVDVFTAPNKIAPGGITGLSTILNHLFQSPIGLVALCFNIPLFLWGGAEIGYKLVGRTIAATVITSLMIDFLKPILVPYTGNNMLASIFGGLCEGVALSLVFMRGGTTGGTDLIAKLLGKHFRNLSTGKLMLAVDSIIVVISAFAYKSLESALYATIAIFVSSRVIDTVLYGIDSGSGKIVYIMSQHNNEIAKQIIKELGRGVTFLDSVGAYTGNKNETALCAVGRTEVYNLMDIVKKIDPEAFMIVGDAAQINGQGFKVAQNDDTSLFDLIKKFKNKNK